MNKTEQKVFDYAQSVEWDYDKVDNFIYNLPEEEFDEIECPAYISNKAKYFIEKYKPKDLCEGYKEGEEYSPLTITISIEDYNRLRKLEIKKQIKKLKKELKGL